MTTLTERRRRFTELHRDGLFLMPNAWDVGSARVLLSLGAVAIATTSSGHAASLGKRDQQVTLDELLAHVAALSSAVTIPLNVDAERCFADDPEGVGRNVRLIAEAGAAGCSIEDYDPATGAIDDLASAVDRVSAAVAAAHEQGVVLTARAENHLYGVADLDDTIDRLRAYRGAGADVVYAPGLVEPDHIDRLVKAVDAPVNVLALRRTPPIGELARLGVRRISTGGGLAKAAYGAVVAAMRELQAEGTSTYLDRAMPGSELEAAM